MDHIIEPVEIKEIREKYSAGTTYKELEREYGVPQSTLKLWRKKYEWKRKKQNKAKKSKGAPKGNKNSLKHGLYSKYFPTEIMNIMEEINKDSQIDILWQSIVIQHARVIQSQKIMHVKNKRDMSKELKKEKIMEGDKYTTEEKEYEIQFAWDKQANFLRAQSTAFATLNRMLKEYDEMLHKNWELATEEQKLRVDKLKKDIKSDIGETIRVEFTKASDKK